MKKETILDQLQQLLKSVQQSEKYQNNYTKEQKEIVDAYAKGNSAN